MAAFIVAMTFIGADGTDAGQPPVLIVMGDSLSIGCCAPEEDTWPAIFSTRLDADLANIAVGATTSTSLINEVFTWASGRTQPQLDEAISLLGELPDAAAVTVTVGTNDLFTMLSLCLADPPNCETIVAEGSAQYRVNLGFILGTLRAALQPTTPLIVMNLHVGGQEQPLNSIIASEVSTHGALLADVAVYFEELPDLLMPDGIHKNAAGHRVIADVFTNARPPDSDGDGLSDLMEAVFGSDPDVEDTDGDGCTDGVEFKPRASAGGQRDPTMFWDFYDVWTRPAGDPNSWERNKVITIIDILGVAVRFGAGPAPPAKPQAVAEALTPPTDDNGYHIAFDRGPIIGANHWDRAPADGTINVINDVLGVALQFGHGCR